ncbi:hypothetical protein HSBAA_07060 [Vreelandella sulfidaeris]|uniref:Uncharacterized protein n=1 Tax=Vreelandella sulfidaeris TaxID=115553 RepID=A0A455U0F3_9GAMM|nr:hypothetical protein HSBAA_07060 [Halomonas sulfidaeris]
MPVLLGMGLIVRVLSFVCYPYNKRAFIFYEPKSCVSLFLNQCITCRPTPLLLAGIIHLTDSALAELWMAELAISGVSGVYIAVAVGCFIVLCVGTLASAAFAPSVVVASDVVARSKPASRQPQAAAPVEDDEEEDIIDPNDGREEGGK